MFNLFGAYIVSNKVFIGIIAFAVIGMVGLLVLQKKDAPAPASRLGYDQADEGRDHLTEGQGTYTDYKAKIPTSGPHMGLSPYQAYEQELPAQNYIHNLEHGGIVISYRPDTDPATVQKLKGLFAKPFARKEFAPTEAIVMPREGQEKPIVMASWNHIVEFDNYDEPKLMEQYKLNTGKAPEARA